MFSANSYRGIEKRKLVITAHFLASLLALELFSGRSPLGRAHLKVTSVKADSDGRLELHSSTVLDAFFLWVLPVLVIGVTGSSCASGSQSP